MKNSFLLLSTTLIHSCKISNNNNVSRKREEKSKILNFPDSQFNRPPHIYTHLLARNLEASRNSVYLAERRVAKVSSTVLSANEDLSQTFRNCVIRPNEPTDRPG